MVLAKTEPSPKKELSAYTHGREAPKNADIAQKEKSMRKRMSKLELQCIAAFILTPWFFNSLKKEYVISNLVILKQEYRKEYLRRMLL